MPSRSKICLPPLPLHLHSRICPLFLTLHLRLTNLKREQPIQTQIWSVENQIHPRSHRGFDACASVFTEQLLRHVSGMSRTKGLPGHPWRRMPTSCLTGVMILQIIDKWNSEGA